MKEKVPQLSQELFRIKLRIEEQLSQGNKTDEEFYNLILKTIDFLKNKRIGEPISKRLPIYRYFEDRYGVTNLFLIKISKEARAFYTNLSGGQYKILKIILEIHQTHKEYEKKGGYN